MSTTPFARPPRLVVALLAVGVLGGLVPFEPAGASASAEPVATAVPILEQLEPALPAPGAVLVVTGRVEMGAVDLRSVDVRLRIGRSPITSRSELAAVELGAGTPDGTPDELPEPSNSRDGVVVEPATTRLAPTAAAGQILPFRLETPLDDLGLERFGTYVVSVEVRATDRAGARDRFGLVRTTMVWTPDPASVAATPLTWLWPVLGEPAQPPEALADAVAPGGRLEVLARVGGAQSRAGTPVLWVLDADTLGAAAGLEDNRWLRDLSARVASSGPGGATLLPYADPDLVAVIRAGSAESLVEGTALAQQEAERLLGSAPSAEPAWPAGGLLDAETLSTLDAAGVTAVVVSDASLPVRGNPPYTPDAVAAFPDLPDGPRAWVVDSGVSDLLARNVGDQPAQLMTRQRFLAETAVITAERPGDPRSLIVAPPRRWAPTEAWASSLLSLTRQAPWLTMRTPAALRSAVPNPPARRGPEYDAAARADELPTAYIQDIDRILDRVDVVASTTSEPASLRDPFLSEALRGMSTGWRDREAEADAYVEQLDARVDALESSIAIVTSGRVGLSAGRGQIPISIRNDLDQDVTVRLGMTARPAVRLSFEDPGLIVVPAGQTATPQVGADAAANGRVEVTVQLLSPDGRVFGTPAQIVVNATAYGTVAAIAVGGALVVLFSAVAVRIVRRIRGRSVS
ncbi:MAG: DUF6049 family protein [Candidatus Nanopelagicales bacterium]